MIRNLILCELMQITTDTNISSVKYCGTEIPRVLLYDATFVVLTFTSDVYETKRGFKISYKISLRKGCTFGIYYYFLQK